MHKYFSFEIEALDDKKLKRRFRASNYQVRTTLPSGRSFLLVVAGGAKACFLASVLFDGQDASPSQALHLHNAAPPVRRVESSAAQHR
jgi:hypothetical protein